MIQIFEEGYFVNNRITDSRLSSVLNETKSFSAGTLMPNKTTVFLSHKHSDLSEMKDFLGFLEKMYNVAVYIDSKDPNMPENTSGETAKRIKAIIKKCDKFILLATDNAIESKWCNWELGFGDANKYINNHIAILPIKKKGINDLYYKGKEYLYIYPCIAFYSGSEKYKDGSFIKAGYYVRTKDSNGNSNITPLSDWLKKR